MNVPTTIRILSAGAPKTGVQMCVEAYSEKSGRPCDVEFATAPVIGERVSLGRAGAEIIVAPMPALEEFARAGWIIAQSVAAIGSVAAGVAVRCGAEAPDLSTVETFRAALVGADGLVYNRASSGQTIATIIENLGIAAAVADKTVRVANGAAVMKYLAVDCRDKMFGFGQIPEIRRHEDLGIRLVGPLPDALGGVTTYGVGLVSAAADDGGAADLIASMTSPEGARIFEKNGIV